MTSGHCPDPICSCNFDRNSEGKVLYSWPCRADDNLKILSSLDYYTSLLDRQGDLAKPRIAHRIDSATGGLLVVVKTHQAEKKVKESFEKRYCKKRYRAIVFGKLVQNKHLYTDLTKEEEREDYTGMGVINAPLSGKASTTRYSVVSHTPCDHPMVSFFV